MATSSYGNSYTYSSGGQSYTATPTASTTAAQKAAVASNSAYTPTSSGGGASSAVPAGWSPTAWAQQQSDMASYFPNLVAGGTGTTAPKLSQAPTVTPTIDGGNLSSLTSLKTPPITPTSSYQDIQNFANSLVTQQAEAPKTPIDQERSDLKSKLSDLIGVEGNKSTDFSSLNSQYQVPQMVQQLNDLNLQIAQKKNEFTQQSETAENKAIPTPFIVGEQTQIQRQSAIVLGALSATAQALQGNIQLANDTIDRTLKMKYDPIEKQIDYTKSLLDVNYQDLSLQEKRRADAASAMLDQQKQQIEDLRSAQKDTFNAIINNPDLSVSQKQKANQELVSASTVEDVRSIGINYGGNSYDTLYKKLQIQKLQQEIDINGSFGGDPSQAIAYAQQYASTGQIPTGLPKGQFGIIAGIAKELPKQNGEIVDANTGVKSSKLSSTQTDAYGALKDFINKTDQATELFGKVNHGLAAGILGSAFPSQDRQKYDALRGEMVDLLARARSGAAISSNEEAMYEAKIPGSFNKTLFFGDSGTTKLSSLKSSISGKLDAGLRANGVSMYGFSKIDVGGKNYTVGDIIDVNGVKGRINPDGTITQL